jgi:hypothetical protein
VASKIHKQSSNLKLGIIIGKLIIYMKRKALPAKIYAVPENFYEFSLFCALSIQNDKPT